MRRVLICLCFAGLVSPARGASGPQRDGAEILRDMRVSLGGEHVLDGIQSISMRAEGEMTAKGLRLRIVDEYLVLLPDNYLRIRNMDLADISQYSTPNASRMFSGFQGPHLIRKVNGPLPLKGNPDADRLMLAKWRHDAARLVLGLTGRALSTYPLEFAGSGTENVGGSTYNTVEARGQEGVVMRLYVDAKTHLPAMIATSGLQRTPETRWLVSDFKKTAGLTWPRQIEEQVEGGVTETLTVKSWKLNPKLHPRTFVPR